VRHAAAGCTDLTTKFIDVSEYQNGRAKLSTTSGSFRRPESCRQRMYCLFMTMTARLEVATTRVAEEP
jgi:hypothetical protein